MNDDLPVVELGDEIDLHAFHPRDVRGLLADFIDAAAERGVLRVRIVHGKGRSVLKQITHAELSANPNIQTFYDQPNNWGATIAILRKGPASALIP